MSTIIGKMREYLENCYSKKYIGVNYEDDALNAYKYIFPSENKNYVDPDLYSPLLYKMWGEILKKKNIIRSYEIIIKDYRYVIKAQYVSEQSQKSIILGSDGLLSIGKCDGDIKLHRNIGGFALWPSHCGGVNFRRNCYNDDIFMALEDIDRFYQCPEKYKGVIPKKDYEWFNHLKDNGNFMDIFFFKEYQTFNGNLLAFENHRTDEMTKFLNK